MPKTTVDSSHISSIDYSIITGNLTVEFKNGKSYEYADVSKATYAAFLIAPSKGLFLSNNLKGKYETSKLPG